MNAILCNENPQSILFKKLSSKQGGDVIIYVLHICTI